MDYGVAGPRNWFGLPEAERSTRAKLTDDICIIDEKEFYVRGCLEIPVSDSSEALVLGVWASVSEKSFRYILDRWNSPIPENEPPRFGWLCTWIDGYPEPHEIKCHVFLRSNNLRPRLDLEPSDYPLAVEQHNGITMERVKKLAADVSHARELEEFGRLNRSGHRDARFAGTTTE